MKRNGPSRGRLRQLNSAALGGCESHPTIPRSGLSIRSKHTVPIPRRERKKAAEIVSGLSGKNTCLMKSPPLPRMLLQAWRRVEPK